MFNLDFDVQNFLIYRNTKFRSTADSMIAGMPRRIYVLFIKSTNFAGTVETNPFRKTQITIQIYHNLFVDYEHFNLTKIALNINGVVRSLDHMDFVHGLGVTAYHALLKACSVSNSDFCFDIKDFEGCNSIFACKHIYLY